MSIVENNEVLHHSSIEPISASQHIKQALLQDVILSLAMEQRAVSQLIQAEAKHMQSYFNLDNQTRLTQLEHQQFQEHFIKIMEGLLEKQKLSMRLLELSKSMLKED